MGAEGSRSRPARSGLSVQPSPAGRRRRLPEPDWPGRCGNLPGQVLPGRADPPALAEATLSRCRATAGHISPASVKRCQAGQVVPGPARAGRDHPAGQEVLRPVFTHRAQHPSPTTNSAFSARPKKDSTVGPRECHKGQASWMPGAGEVRHRRRRSLTGTSSARFGGAAGGAPPSAPELPST